MTAGMWLLRIARLLLDERAVARLVEPTIADLQQEMHEAGSSRAMRCLVRCRGYVAFCAVVLSIPFSRRSHHMPMKLSALVHVAPLYGIGAFLVVFMWQMLNWSIVVATISGLLLALGLRRWNDRHPTTLAIPPSIDDDSRLQINIALVPVAANVGGLMFMCGSIAILTAGLPLVRGFLIIALAGGVVMAYGLSAWHSAHPGRRLPDNSLGRLSPEVR